MYISLSFSFLLALSMNLAELRRRLLTDQTRLPCEADLFLTIRKESCLCGSGSLVRTGMFLACSDFSGSSRENLRCLSFNVHDFFS